ncbi:MAG: hypothetical protein WDZ52_08305 [Pseudohongiellaceae bacterium]
MRNLILAALFVAVSSCGASGPSLTSMTDAEIVAYNREKPVAEHIYCVTGTSSSSFIRRRTCQTYEDWMAHNEKSAMQLDVLNSRPSYSLPNSIQDGPARN